MVIWKESESKEGTSMERGGGLSVPAGVFPSWSHFFSFHIACLQTKEKSPCHTHNPPPTQTTCIIFAYHGNNIPIMQVFCICTHLPITHRAFQILITGHQLWYLLVLKGFHYQHPLKMSVQKYYRHFDFISRSQALTMIAFLLKRSKRGRGSYGSAIWSILPVLQQIWNSA